MTVHHIPAHGEGWGELEEMLSNERMIIRPGALLDHAEVPLVIYNGSERHVIGTATVDGATVSASVDHPLAEEVMDLLMGRPGDFHFSLDVPEGYHNPFGKPKAKPVF